MPDRDKVLTWLEICGKNNDCSGCCPYSENGFGEYGQCRESLMADAYALLKEQKAKWVEYGSTDVCRLIKCSNCGLKFIVGNNISYDEWIEDRNYCRRCGARMVKQ